MQFRVPVFLLRKLYSPILTRCFGELSVQTEPENQCEAGVALISQNLNNKHSLNALSSQNPN
jgi:hypothetical protein